MKRALATLLLLTLMTSGGGRLMAAQRPLPAPTSTPSPDVHHDFQTRVYFQGLAWALGHALVLGIVEPGTTNYRVNAVYLNGGEGEFQVIGQLTGKCFRIRQTVAHGEGAADEQGRGTGGVEFKARFGDADAMGVEGDIYGAVSNPESA